MKAATNIFFTLAVAINSLRCTAYVVVPSPSKSSFVGVTSYATQVAIRGKKKYSTTSIGTRRTSSTTCIYSVPYLPNIEEEEDDDGSFFLRASQQASKDRYEMLNQGKDPLAVSLSTASVKEEEPNQQQQRDAVEKGKVAAVNDVSDSSGSSADAEISSPTLAKDDYDGLLSSLAESPLAKSLEEENVDTEQDTDVEKSSSSSPPSTLDEIKRVEDEIAAVKSQMKYRFQKRLMDARMAYNNNVNRVGEGSTAEEMEAARNARLTAADEVAKILQSGEEELEEDEEAVPTTTSTSTVDVGEGSTAEEMEEARNARLAAADEIAKTLKKTVESTAETSTVSLEEEENGETKAEPSELETQPVSSTPPLSSPPPPPPASTKSEEESSNAAKQPLVSSDGKAIYEPSQSALSINQENVDNGLMVLTRSFLVLNSIVQRLDKDKE